MIEKVFQEGQKVKHLQSWLNKETTKKRFQNALNQYLKSQRKISMRGKFLVLIIDAQWRRFKGRMWTEYFIAIKSSDKDEALILDPILLQEHENADTWMRLLEQLPKGILKRVVAVVSDGIRGLKGLITQRGWMHQRCHFHQLAKLQNIRGKKKHLKGKETREKIFQLSKKILSTHSESWVTRYQTQLKKLIASPDCPRYGRMAVKEMFRRLDDFRLFIYHPEWNLPKTSNVMESLGNKIRSTVRKVNTPNAVGKWSVATVRQHTKFVCKRAVYQPN